MKEHTMKGNSEFSWLDDLKQMRAQKEDDEEKDDDEYSEENIFLSQVYGGDVLFDATLFGVGVLGICCF